MSEQHPSRIGDRLVSAGLVKRDDVEQAAASAEEHGRRLGDELLDLGLLHERELYRHLAAQRDLPFADADSLFEELDAEVAQRLSRPRQLELGALPLCKREERLRVACCNLDERPRTIARATGTRARRLELVIVTPTDLRRLQWELDLRRKPDADDRLARRGPDLLDEELRDQSAGVALFDMALAEAVSQKASDIHIEPTAEGGRIRVRVDGELRPCPHLELDDERLRALVSVIKVRSQLDITERRRPQDGRFHLRIAGHPYDVRVQTQPSLHGEAAVMRLLSPDEDLLALERLGFDEPLQADFLRLIGSPSGLVLVAGPSGSGKTTTLYAGLQLLAEDETRKVLTIEDPIEYALEGTVQVQVDREHGFGFSEAVRTFVREDPDVILVGEIRDSETALEALRASQTGHLVLASIHANDAVDAIQRLFDLGQHANSIAAELVAVVAQRLARRICPACRTQHEPDRSLLREIFRADAPRPQSAFRGAGCDLCRGFGTRGRIAIAEVMPSSRALRAAIARHAPIDDLRDAARRAGLRSMRDAAVAHAEKGLIAFEELPRLLQAELLLDDGHGPADGD